MRELWYVIICFTLGLLSSHHAFAQVEKMNALLIEADSLSKTNIPQAFDVAQKALALAEKMQDSDLAGKVSKTPLYLYQKEAFIHYAEKKLERNEVSINEQVYLHHQLMRYYVSVDADFDQAFIHLIKIRELLEAHPSSLMYKVVLGDAYYIAYWINHVQSDLVKAREYANLMIKHAEQQELPQLKLTALMGLAEIDQHEGHVRSAINRFLDLEGRLLQHPDSVQLNRLYLLLSNAYVDFENEDSAFYYGKKAYHMVPANNAQLKAFSTIHVARGFIKEGHADSAIIFADKALKVVEDLGAKKEIKDIHNVLAEAYKTNGNYKQALYHIEEFLKLEQEQASLQSAANISNLEAELEAQRHQTELQKEKAEVVKRDAKIRQQRTQTIGLIAGLLLAIGLIVIAVRSYMSKKKDAETIAVQKTIVEEKNREILDSIAYAKRIQSAILPPAGLVKEYLNESFILYKPKDIVAGDFYWMEPQKDRILFAACDCTGHGVPGAMVSVVCNNGLNRAVREFGLTDPGKILDKTRAIVISEFEKSEEEVQDGMDMALCALHTQTHTLQYAGANNPLWIVRNGNNEIEEIKADKQPIGKYAAASPFTTHEVKLHKGDTIYIFSDGYADQFGGDKGKKYKSGQMKKLLLSLQDKNMATQRQMLDAAFEQWRGDIEQVDDVCIIGVRV